MEYRKFDNVIVARIDKDEEISEQLRVIAIKENIKLASVQALGAINDFNGWRILCTSSYECRKSEGRGVWRTSEQSDCQCNL